MGWSDPAMMSPVLAEAAFQADIGELVQAESRHGLHLMHVEAERCAPLAVLPAQPASLQPNTGTVSHCTVFM